MLNNYLNLIKLSSRLKLYSILTQSLTNPNLFHNFSSNPYDKIYSKQEQGLLSIFKKCNTKKHIQQIHGHVVKLGFFQNLFVVGKIVVFCSVSNVCLMDYAVSVFDKIAKPDGFLWNSMIRGFGRVNDFDKVFFYFKMMADNGQVVDNFTLSFLLKACGEFGSVLLGKQVHCCVVKLGFECNVFVRNTLIHMYGMLNDVCVARKLFDETGEAGLVAWNTIIDCYVCCGEFKEALDLFSRMQNEGVKPDNATLVVILSACAALGELELGRWVHSVVDKSFYVKDVSLANSLMNMYARCGEVEEALEIFGKINDKNIVTWNTMILGLAAYGHVEKALDVFSLMINQKHAQPNDVTFLGVLTACSHGGMIKQGRLYFNKMTNEYDIKPTIKHYGCMVDMLSRAGLVTEAYHLVQNLPIKCNAIVLRTLLAGCQMHGVIKLAEIVRRHLLEVDPEYSSDYVLLANTYAGFEDWNQVSSVRRLMTVDGVQKPSPGNSFIGVA